MTNLAHALTSDTTRRTYLALMTDDSERRDTPTIEAPALPSEAPTSADNERPAPLVALNPPPLARATQGDSYFADAAREFSGALVEMRLARQEIADGFRGQGSKIDELKRESAEHARELTANYSLLSGEFKTFRAVIEARLDDGERRFDAIEQQLAELKREQLAAAHRQLEAAAKIASLETELQTLRSNAVRPPVAPAG